MAIPKKIINFLEKSKAKYEIVEHRKVFTAYDKAATLRMPEKISIKTLVIRTSPPLKEFALVNISADKNLDKEKLKKKINILRKKEGGKAVKKIDFVTEKWVKSNLKGMKPGAMPPFGNLYGMEVFVAETLTVNKTIAFNAGSHTELIKLAYKDFQKLVEPTVIKFSHKTLV